LPSPKQLAVLTIGTLLFISPPAARAAQQSAVIGLSCSLSAGTETAKLGIDLDPTQNWSILSIFTLEDQSQALVTLDTTGLNVHSLPTAMLPDDVIDSVAADMGQPPKYVEDITPLRTSATKDGIDLAFQYIVNSEYYTLTGTIDNATGKASFSTAPMDNFITDPPQAATLTWAGKCTPDPSLRDPSYEAFQIQAPQNAQQP
jgi:hypothetical protein